MHFQRSKQNQNAHATGTPEAFCLIPLSKELGGLSFGPLRAIRCCDSQLLLPWSTPPIPVDFQFSVKRRRPICSPVLPAALSAPATPSPKPWQLSCLCRGPGKILDLQMRTMLPPQSSVDPH